MKQLALSVLTLPATSRLFHPFVRSRATILTLHRFADPERQTPGHPAGMLDLQLAALRRGGYHLMGLNTLMQQLVAGVPLHPRSVVFTVDDGYGDFARMAAPVFARYDCPVTVFLTTGYLDRECWFWWDQVEYVIFAGPGAAELELDGVTWSGSWSGSAAAQAVAGDLVERLKQIPDHQKQVVIARLSEHLDVPIPATVPAQYAPMTWDEVRSLHHQGVAFGPHTVNHPVLSRTLDRQSDFELRQSWQRLSAEIASPAPVFCYPNGTLDAFGSREMATLHSMGLLGAVTIAHDHASLATIRDGGPDARFLIPRFPCPESRAGLIQIVSGMEFVKSRIRRWSGVR